MSGNANQPPVRLASYNIRKARGLDGRRDPHRSAAVIAALDADVVAVQEADRRLGRRPAALTWAAIRSETDLVPLVSVSESPVSLGWHGNALLMRPEFEATHVARVPLSSPDPRGAVLVELAMPTEKLRLVAVHLSLLRRYRRRQLAEIRAAIAARAAMPTVYPWRFQRMAPTAGIGTAGRRLHGGQPGPQLSRRATCCSA